MTQPAATYHVGQPPKPRKTGPKPGTLIAVGAVSVLAIGAVVLAFALGWARAGTPAATASSPAALSAETQHECITIRRAHEAWAKNLTRLTAMTPAGADSKFWLGMLKEDGDAYGKATTGYPDQPAKTLAVTVAQYNVDLSMVNLEVSLGGRFTTERHDKVVTQANVVKASYDTFYAITCTPK